MSGSEQHDWVALVSVDDHGCIGGIANRNLMEVDFAERQAMLEEAQEVLRGVAQYTERASTVQRVCDHQAQIITLQKEVPDLKSKQFLPLQCNNAEIESRIQTLTAQRDDHLMRPAAPGTDEELQQELEDMTQDAGQSGEEVRSLRTQFANALTLAAKAAPAALQAPDDRGPNFPDSPEFPLSDRTKPRGWIAKLRMVI
jgi:cell division septum initiation protein DivIVA